MSRKVSQILPVGQVSPQLQQFLQSCGGSSSSGPSPSDKIDRLFVSKLPMEVTREEVHTYFSAFGEITDVYLPMQPGSRMHKGICFVSFSSPQSASKAMASAPHEMRGSFIHVDVAVPRAPPPGTVTSQVASGSRLFLTKVSPDITRVDLQIYFSKFGELTDCYVPPGNKGIAFLSFSSPECAQAVLQNATHQVKPGSIVVASPAYDRPPPGTPGGKGWGKGGSSGYDAAAAPSFGGLSGLAALAPPLSTLSGASSGLGLGSSAGLLNSLALSSGAAGGLGGSGLGASGLGGLGSSAATQQLLTAALTQQLLSATAAAAPTPAEQLLGALSGRSQTQPLLQQAALGALMGQDSQLLLQQQALQQQLLAATAAAAPEAGGSGAAAQAEPTPSAADYLARALGSGGLAAALDANAGQTSAQALIAAQSEEIVAAFSALRSADGQAGAGSSTRRSAPY